MRTRSWKSLVDSLESPVLVKGGPSSSDVLNSINQKVYHDMVRLQSKVQDLDRTQQLLSVYMEQQAVGIQSLVNHLQTIIPSAPQGRGVADFFSSDFVHVNNTANVDQDFGQVTLPISSVQEKLHFVDSEGKTWIPNDSRLKFLIKDSFTPDIIPPEEEFYNSSEDFWGIGNQPGKFFLGGNLQSEKFVFIKAILPQTLNTHRLANRVTFYPIPAFSHSLVGAYYKKTNNSWYKIDISYLLGYTETTSPPQVSFLGPTRLHFPPSEITQVCLVLKSSGWWGIQQLSVQLAEYAISALLSVDLSYYNPTSISRVIVLGKDPHILNGYDISTSGSIVSIPISQQESYSTPIITGIDARW